MTSEIRSDGNPVSNVVPLPFSRYLTLRIFYATVLNIDSISGLVNVSNYFGFLSNGKTIGITTSPWINRINVAGKFRPVQRSILFVL